MGITGLVTLRNSKFGVAILVALCIGAGDTRAWKEGVPHDEHLQCQTLPLAGADKLVVRVTPTNGSFGLPVLAGLSSGKVLWQRSFPDSDEVNVAKLWVACDGQTITIRFSYPADLSVVVQEFAWNGQALTRLSRQIEKR